MALSPRSVNTRRPFNEPCCRKIRCDRTPTTSELTRHVRDALCHHLIVGVESIDEDANTGEAVRRDVDHVAFDGRLSPVLTQAILEREQLLPGFDEELLELYEDLRRQKRGVGAAALIAGVCQGCHQKLSAMELARLKREAGVKRCEYCRRILVSE